jgi:hypothetical protein
MPHAAGDFPAIRARMEPLRRVEAGAEAPAVKLSRDSANPSFSTLGAVSFSSGGAANPCDLRSRHVARGAAD